MTNQQPSDPNSPGSNKKLNLDETIAVILSFGVIGTILVYSLTRDNNFFSNPLFSGSTSTTTEAPVAANNLPTRETEPRDTKYLIKDKPPQVASQPRRTTVVVPIPVETQPQPIPKSRVTVEPIPPIPPIPETKIDPQPIPEVETVPPEEVTSLYADVPKDYWAYSFIAPLAQEKLITASSDQNLNPEENLTREQYAVLLNETFQLRAKQGEQEFEDLDEESRMGIMIENAVQAKFLEGYPEEVFKPGEPITKLQVLLSLVSGSELKPSENAETILQEAYTDWEEIPEYARPAIAAAIESSLVVNYPNKDEFNFDQRVTRAETLAMIHQALVTQDKLEPIESEYIFKPRG